EPRTTGLAQGRDGSHGPWLPVPTAVPTVPRTRRRAAWTRGRHARMPRDGPSPSRRTVGRRRQARQRRTSRLMIVRRPERRTPAQEGVLVFRLAHATSMLPLVRGRQPAKEGVFYCAGAQKPISPVDTRDRCSSVPPRYHQQGGGQTGDARSHTVPCFRSREQDVKPFLGEVPVVRQHVGAPFAAHDQHGATIGEAI